METLKKLEQSTVVAKMNNYNPSPKIDRIYITLQGMDKYYRGDVNTKIYYDKLAGKIITEKAAKGMTSRAFDAAMERFKQEMGL